MKKICLTVSIAFIGLACVVLLPGTEAADNDGPANHHLAPVEDDMHEFMEYAFEPFFKQLKTALSAEPADKKAWVPVKANALILAENGNLLMLRGPDENKAEWDRLSAELRNQGQLLYKAAKKREYESTKKQYVAFVAKCNSCHEKFADGEHIQKP